MADFIEPFGLVLQKNAGTDTFLPEYAQLPTGVNTLLVTVPGTHDTMLSIASGPTWANTFEHVEIPAGTKNLVHTVGVRADEARYFVLTSYFGVDVTMRAAVTVTNIPLK